MPKKKTMLDDDPIPILGWAGPGGDMINEKVMSGMAEAGFTVSHSSPRESVDEVIRALDVAHACGVRLMLQHPAWHVGDDFVLDQKRETQIRDLVARVKDHPGLFGYHLRDEPMFGLFGTLAKVHGLISGLDNYHVCYINHYPPIQGFGAPTVDRFWESYIEQVKPHLLSYDHYSITVGTQAEIDSLAGEPYVFPEEKVIVKRDYFECLELLRTFSVRLNIPLWVFTCSVRHGPYPEPTEGHMRFQLMNNLAYGARGLQYFTYAHAEAMVRKDGSTTDTWEIARRINSDIRALTPVLKDLRNIGVFRTGKLWSGTRHLRATGWVKPELDCEGDPVTMGFFLDPKDNLHAMVVNGNPCSWARITLKVRDEKSKLYCFNPKTGKAGELWPVNPQSQLVVLAPGEGRLFKIGGTGESRDF